VRLGKDRLDVVTEAQVVDEVRVSDGLVVVLEATQLRVLEAEVAEVEGAPELCLAHAPGARLVVVACPLVDANALAIHLQGSPKNRTLFRTLCNFIKY